MPALEPQAAVLVRSAVDPRFMPNSPLITLMTDFGSGSPYVAAMKGVIYSLNPIATVVDLSHSVPPQDVRAGAWTWAETTPYFPRGSIHVGVVDPGVGTSRKLVCAVIDESVYLAPDNGLLDRLARRCAPTTIVALAEPEYWLPQVSNTFHGRDILAPVAAAQPGFERRSARPDAPPACGTFVARGQRHAR